MKCKKCNSELMGTENFCRKCGFPVKDTSESLNEDNNTLDESSNKKENLDDTSIDLKDVVSSNLIKKDEKYKIENTQELLVNSTDSSKKIKKILDELKFSKNDENQNDENDSKEDTIKKQFEESKKKIDDLENKTIIVETKNENDTNTSSEKDKDNEVDENIKNNKDNEENISVEKEEIVEEKNVEEKIDSNNQEDDEIEIDEEEDIFEENNSKSGNGKFVFVLLLFILTLCSSVYLLVSNFSLKEKIKNLDTESNKNSENISKESSKTSNSNINSNVKNYYGCYLLDNNIGYSVVDFAIDLSYNNIEFDFAIDSNIAFDSIKNTKDEYKKLLEKKNYKISSYGTKVIDEREYVFFEASNIANQKYLIVYTNGLKNDSFAFVINNDAQTINFDNLKIINRYINTLRCENNNKITSSDYFIKK